LTLYSPGHSITQDPWMRSFERESSKYTNNKDPTDDIVFMRV